MADDNYDELMQRAKQYANNGMLRKALMALEAAREINETDKVNRRIVKIKEMLEDASSSENDETSENNQDEGFKELKDGLKIDADIYGKLFPHQVEGVQFMWSSIHLDRRIRGGMLSDDMGLGKTIQVSAFIGALVDMGEARNFLIVLPTSLIANWENELKKWVPAINIFKFTTDGGVAKRKRNLQLAQRSTAVLLTTYGLVTTNSETLCLDARGARFEWDYVILDEAHNIKNMSAKRTKEAHKLNSKRRLILTGTPIMNQLDDFYSLVEFFSFGYGLLAENMAQFRQQYKGPIERARTKNSTSSEIRFGNSQAAKLTAQTKKFILRRTKESLNAAKVECNEQPQFPKLGLKHDFILWCKMTPKQLKMYDDFLASDEVRHALMTKASPLVQCTVLKKLCDHPRRLSVTQCEYLGIETGLNKSVMADRNMCVASDYIKNVDLDTLLEESGKLRALSSLVEIIDGKFLLFSSSVKLLDMIEKLLRDKGMRLLRMDGRDKASRRQELVDEYQRDSSINAMLLTTGVGSVGLTLTAATRVIIFDPAWNPGSDDQAVDRAYRIGQAKPVVVFRLITCDTIEEKIYRRQIFKKSIIAQNNGENQDPFRHFSGDDIRQLFGKPSNPMQSETQMQLSALASRRETYEQLEQLLDNLEKMNALHAGIHDHNMVFDPKNQTLVNDAMANNPKMEPIYGGEVLTHNTGAGRYDPANESDLRQHRIDQYFQREAAQEDNDGRINENEMAAKASTDNHWQIHDDDELSIKKKESEVIEIGDSTDDELEIISEQPNAIVMDLTMDDSPSQPPNMFESTRVAPKPKNLTRVLSQEEEIDSLNESVNSMKMDADNDGDDSDALVIDENVTPPRSSTSTQQKQPRASTMAFTPGKVKPSDLRFDVTLDSSSSSLEDIDLPTNTSEVDPVTLASSDEEEDETNTSENLFADQSSGQSVQQQPQQTPSTKFRRRSQLPPRPETNDDSNEQAIEDFDGSILRSQEKEKTRRFDLTTDSSCDDEGDDLQLSGRRPLGEMSMNSSLERPVKRRQLYVETTSDESETDIIASSD